MLRPTSCEFGATRCRNSVEAIGEGRSKCAFCRLAPDSQNVTTQHWRPVEPRVKHPVLEREKRDAGQRRARAAHEARRRRDTQRQRVVRRAGQAETATTTHIITATRNSGRNNRDGDHVAAGQITLDTKLQSTRDNPVVRLLELAKVRADAQRAGNPIGGLVLRNKYDVGVVVFLEQDFARHILPRL